MGGTLFSLVTVDVATGAKKTFFGDNAKPFEGPVWMPDGRGVLGLLHGVRSTFNQTQIAFVSYPEAKLTPVTHDTNSYSYVSPAANGKSFSAVLTEGRWNISVMPASASSAQGHVLTSAVADTNFTWTTDGFLISDQGSSLNRIDPASGNKTMIATEEGTSSGNPAACADGRYVLFELGFRGGSSVNNVWRMDASGGNLKQITSGNADIHSVCSSDGHWVYYMQQGEETKLVRVPIDGGAPQTISTLPVDSSQFDLSPDGKLAAFATLEHSGEHKEKLVLADTGSKSLKCDSGVSCDSKVMAFERPRAGLIRFSRDGKAVIYPIRENGVDNLWLQPLDGSKGRQLTDFTAEHIYDFHWSFDGKQLALVRGHTDADVVLIRDTQP
jgi:Tol biopolymer transport system component